MYETKEDILKQIELAKEGKFWTQVFYNTAYEHIKHKYPIVVPSYNRPNNLITQKLINSFTDEYNWPIFLVIRKSQEKDYLNYVDKSHLIVCEDSEIDNIAKVRNKILDLFDEQIFMFDDDLKGFTYGVADTYLNDKNKYRSNSFTPSKVNPFRILAMWQIIHEESLKYNVSISTLLNAGFSFALQHTNADRSIRLYSGLCTGVVCLNIPILKEHNIKYTDDGGHEDLDLQFQALSKGLPTVAYTFMSYDVPPMEATFNGYKTMEDRLKTQSDIMKKTWGDTPWVKFYTNKKGLDNVGINWFAYRKCNNLDKMYLNVWPLYDLFQK